MAEGEENVEHLDGTYSFRLFSKKATPQHASATGEVYQTINLRSPTPPSTCPGFVVQHRPATYYFAGPSSPKIREQYRQAALNEEEIIKNAQAKWVSHVPITLKLK